MADDFVNFADGLAFVPSLGGLVRCIGLQDYDFVSWLSATSETSVNLGNHMVYEALQDVALRQGSNTVWFQASGSDLTISGTGESAAITGGTIDALVVRNTAGTTRM